MTTPCSPRTAASASSRTSTATTSACPDLYDTSGNTGGAENSTAFWTLMSSGANIGDGSPDGIGDAPTDLGAWERFQLGWLKPQGSKGPFYEVAHAGKKSTHKLGPNVPATK